MALHTDSKSSPQSRYVIRPGDKLYHSEGCIVAPKDAVLANEQDMNNAVPCSGCIAPLLKRATDSESTAAGATHFDFDLKAARELVACKPNKELLFLVADTEGKEFVSEITVATLDDKWMLSALIKRPPKFNLPDRTGERTLRSFFDEIDQAHPDEKAICVLFHNGASHDEPLLKASALLEDFEIPDRFHFGDSISFFKMLTATKPLSSYSLSALYKAVLDEEYDARTGAYHRPHTSAFDVMQLRRLLRFTAVYLFKKASSGGCYTMAQAQKLELPDMPVGEKCLAMASYIRAKITWRIMSCISAKALSVPGVAATADAVYVSARLKRHTAVCPITLRYKLRVETDPDRLARCSFCQHCVKSDKH